jgi:zinc protease
MSGQRETFRAATNPPESGAVRPFKFPDISSQRLDSGLLIKTARLSRLPVVTTKLVLDAGETRVSSARAGLAVLTGDALEGGTLRRTGAELAEALESIGAGLGISTTWDATVVALTCLAERMEEALGLLAEVVLDPAFPADEVERIRDQRLAVIEQRRMDPARLAADSLARFIYQDGVPYGRLIGGTAESVQGISVEDAQAFTEERYLPEGSGLVVVGDVAESEVRSLAERTFGEWTGAPASDERVEALPGLTERTVFIVDRPGSVQSEIRIGHLGVPRSTPDFFPLQVFNIVLGGAFTSRLNLNLRERHGFTYGVRSRFAYRRAAGPFVVSTAVETDVTAAAVREAVAEVEGLVQGGPTEAEVESARDYLAGIFPLRLEATHQVAAQIGAIIVHDLPDDYYSSYRENIRSVTREDVEAAGRRAVRPEEMAIVIVGDADGIRASLEELELGPVEVHS